MMRRNSLTVRFDARWVAGAYSYARFYGGI